MQQGPMQNTTMQMYTQEPLPSLEVRDSPPEKSPKALILSVPLEILNLFSEFIHEEDDFLALRMTCHSFNTNFREAHHKSIYSVRRLFYCLESFENLLKVSRHPSGMNKYVRRIEISASTPYDYIARGSQFVDRVDANPNGEFDDIRDTILQIADISHIKTKEAAKFRKSGEVVAFLTLALAGFPKLQSIYMERNLQSGNFKRFSRSELNLFFPTVGFSFEKGLRRTLMTFQLNSTYSRGTWLLGSEPSSVYFWNLPVSSLILSGASDLESLTCGHKNCNFKMDVFDVSPNRLSQMTTTLGNLRILKLQLGGIRRPEPEEETRLNTKFSDWLETIGSNIQVLELERNALEYHYGPVLILPTKTGLPKLTKLTLNDTLISRSNLEQFLDTCKTQLEYIKIHKLIFQNGEVESLQWYLLLQYLKENCPRLREACFQPSSFEDLKVVSTFHQFDQLIPDLSAKTTERSIFDGCGWKVSYFATCARPLFEEVRPVGDALSLFQDAEAFWNSITDRKWRDEEFIGNLLR
ncbi:hypothetical protein TWF481_002147 [Arthrobotrys musiformis]|uniref:F-box domain-containing protein n=1 Tax=Arthrobotrys musiformis TaxID=47236 RepID=A0AAV9VUI2_9PEZI